VHEDAEPAAECGARRLEQRRRGAGLRKVARDEGRIASLGAQRRGEVAGLRLEDVNLHAPDGATVSPRRKGARTRQPLGVSERTAAAIASWLASSHCSSAVFLMTPRCSRAAAAAGRAGQDPAPA
jgi:integrase